VAIVHRETRDQRSEELAWPAFLAAGDVFVYVGLGETTLAEICATGRPVFLAPQLPSRANVWVRMRDRLAAAVVERAEARPANDRGTTRPQQGLELLCARLIDRGWVRPRRDVESLRGRLVRGGLARLLRAPVRAGDLVGFSEPPRPELPRIANHIRRMLGVDLKDD
jgi:mitochondrial fission protein ELM1